MQCWAISRSEVVGEQNPSVPGHSDRELEGRACQRARANPSSSASGSFLFFSVSSWFSSLLVEVWKLPTLSQSTAAGRGVGTQAETRPAQDPQRPDCGWGERAFLRDGALWRSLIQACGGSSPQTLVVGEVRYGRRLNLVTCTAFSASCVFDPLGSWNLKFSDLSFVPWLFCQINHLYGMVCVPAHAPFFFSLFGML